MISPDYNFRISVHFFKSPSGSVSRFNPDIWIQSRPHPYDASGVVPFLSMATGFYRAGQGLIDTIHFLALAIFSANRYASLQMAALGVLNVVRGVIEMVPFVGNFVMLLYIKLTQKVFESQIRELIKNKPPMVSTAAAEERKVSRRANIHGLAKNRDDLNVVLRFALGSSMPLNKTIDKIAFYQDLDLQGVYRTEEEFQAALARA